MKRRICMVLVWMLLLCIFSGCDKAQTLDGSGTTTQNTMQAGTPTAPDYGEPEPLPIADRETVGPLFEYDPERRIYIMANNHDDTIVKWKSGIPIFSFDILSLDKLDTSTISLSVPVQSPYTVTVKEIELGSIAISQNDFPDMHCAATQYPYSLYLCYQDFDFRKQSELNNKWDYLLEKTRVYHDMYHTGSIAKEEYKIMVAPYEAATQAYWDHLLAYIEGYKNLRQSDLPQFYVYNVLARFPSETMVDEDFQTVDITIGDTVYHQEIGEVRLRTKLEFPAQNDWEIGGGLAGILGGGLSPQPYNDGYCRVPRYFVFKAERTMTLTELRLENPRQQLQRVWVEVTSPDGLSSKGYWDMSQPMTIYEGDEVVIDIEFYDPAAQNLDYTTRAWGFLIYDYDRGTACKFSEAMIDSSLNYYTLYALIFEGMDLESFYWDYYYLQTELWRYDTEG